MHQAPPAVRDGQKSALDGSDTRSSPKAPSIRGGHNPPGRDRKATAQHLWEKETGGTSCFKTWICMEVCRPGARARALKACSSSGRLQSCLNNLRQGARSAQHP